MTTDNKQMVFMRVTRNLRRRSLALAALVGVSTGALISAAAATEAAVPVIKPLAITTTFDATALLDWAERTYPQFFPGRQTNQSAPPYIYRYYPETQNYLGVAGQTVSVLGPVSNGQRLDVGTLSEFRCQALPDVCFRANGPRIVTGPGGIAAIGVDGRPFAWGTDAMFGYAPPLPGITPRVIPVLARSVVVGHSGGMALDLNGRGFAWGREMGAVAGGDAGAHLSAAAPGPMPWPGQVRQLAFGTGARFDYPWYETLTALLMDGTVWEMNARGIEFKNGRWQVIPAQVPGLTGVQSLSHGFGALHALLLDGTVAAVHPEFGAQRQIVGTSGVRYLSCDGFHCLAVRQDGRVLAWGLGPLGDGPGGAGYSSQAIVVPGVTGAIQVATGGSAGIRGGLRYSAVVTADGRLWTWGTTDSVRDPLRDSPALRTPALMPGVTDATDIGCNDYCVMRRADGSLWGWGVNMHDRFGIGFVPEFVTTPVRIGAIVVPLMGPDGAGRSRLSGPAAALHPSAPSSKPQAGVTTRAAVMAGCAVSQRAKAQHRAPRPQACT